MYNGENTSKNNITIPFSRDIILNVYIYMNQEIKNVFTPGPIVSYRSARKINSYLVRAKLYPLERKAGSEKCGKSGVKFA